MIITKMKEKNAEQPFVIRAFCYVHQDTSGINEIGTEIGPYMAIGFVRRYSI